MCDREIMTWLFSYKFFVTEKSCFIVTKNGIVTITKTNGEKEIKEVEQWIDENCEDESDTIIKNELLDIKNSLNKTRIVTLVFNSAEVCNLKCRYCFANEGTYNNFSEKNIWH